MTVIPACAGMTSVLDIKGKRKIKRVSSQTDRYYICFVAYKQMLSVYRLPHINMHFRRAGALRLGAAHADAGGGEAELDEGAFD